MPESSHFPSLATIILVTMTGAILAPSVSSVVRRSQRAASLTTWSRPIACYIRPRPKLKLNKVQPVLSTLLDYVLMSTPVASIGEKVKDVKGEHPDHIVVIKYVPAVGDSKRAIDEYYSEIMGGGRSTINIFNECEDSLLATPLILDLTILAELLTRIKYRELTIGPDAEFKPLYPVLSLLSYMLKAPLVKPGV